MDVDKEMLNEFIVESREHLENIEDDFLALEKQGKNPDQKLIDKIFRSIHSVKGSSGFLNLSHITEIAHTMETLLQKMRDKLLEPESTYIDTLLAGSDLLTTLLEDPLNDKHPGIKSIHLRLKEILKLAESNLKEPNNSNASKKTKNSKNSKDSETLKDIKNLKDSKNSKDSEDSKQDLKEKKFEEKSPKKETNKSHDQIVQQIDYVQIPTYGFEVDITNIDIEFKHIYIIKFDISELALTADITPVFLVKDLIGMGRIIDSKSYTPAKDLSEQLLNESVFFDVLYATDLEKNSLEMVFNVSEERIIKVIFDKIDLPKKISSDEKNEHKTNTLDFKKEFLSKTIYNNIKQDNLQPVKNIVSVSNKSESKSDSKLEDKRIKTDDIKRTKPALKKQISSQKNYQKSNIAQSKAHSKREPNETIRINVDILDRIMNLAGELVLVRNQHLLLVDKTDPKLADNSQRLDMVTSELQEAIMRTRMQPIGTLFMRLPRIVRDLSKKCGKSIIIIINGNEVELDKTILESLPDPLTHIIRNCCDHGIEKPDIRVKNGKPETGYINLKAYHEAGQINIVIEDDGGGINPNSVKKKAIIKSLKTEEELSRMTEKEIFSLIMLPGFSTAEKTTEISGRGVGMDVVKNTVDQLGGSIDIDSRPGDGTIIHLRLPLTLAIIPSLILMVDNEKFAIPEVSVEELVSIYDEEIFKSIECNGDQEVYRLRNNLLPLIRLNEILKHNEKFTEETRSNISEKYRNYSKEKLKEGKKIQQIMIFAVLKIGSNRFGLIVDQVLGTEEIVVNPLHSTIKPLGIYSGTTIMGDGTVALILDVNGVAAHAGIRFTTDAEKAVESRYRSSKADSHRVLLFQSGKDEQFAVPLLLMRRVELIKSDNIQFIGNRGYISIDGTPTLIIKLDNLLNVSECIRKEKMYLLLPKHTSRPIGILVSDLVDVVNLPLVLNKESYMESGLLGTAIVNEYITIFLDVHSLIEKAETQWFGDEIIENKINDDKHILLVEDTIFFQRLVKGYLESAGFKVTTADNGAIALQKLEGDSFDLIVSDIEMPEMDGLTLLRKVRSNNKYNHLPAIALTSLDSPKDRDIGLKAGFNAYEIKVDRENLMDQIEKLLEDT